MAHAFHEMIESATTLPPRSSQILHYLQCDIWLLAFMLVAPSLQTVFAQQPLQHNPARQETSALSRGNAYQDERLITIEELELIGATKTKRRVFERLLIIKAGDRMPLSELPQRIEHDWQTLETTNFFKHVEISSRPGSEPGNIIIVIEVQERKWPWLEVAGGFSELDGWYIIPLGLRTDNLLGGGNYSGLRYVIGDRITDLYFHFRQPHVFKSDFDLKLELGGGTQRFIHYLDNRKSIQNVVNSRFLLELDGTRGLARYFAVGFNFKKVRPDSIIEYAANGQPVPSPPAALVGLAEETTSNTLYGRLKFDTRDNTSFPRRGQWGTLSLEHAGSFPFSDNQFTRTIIDVRSYHPAGKLVFAWHAKTGKVSESAPFYERFYLGGANSLRGYSERSLTPTGWGTELLLGQVELRFPLAGDWLRPKLSGALFFDGGRIAAADQPSLASEFMFSTGFGFRWKMPIIGTLRCDFAYPLDRDDFHFHLSLGHTF